VVPATLFTASARAGAGATFAGHTDAKVPSSALDCAAAPGVGIVIADTVVSGEQEAVVPLGAANMQDVLATGESAAETEPFPGVAVASSAAEEADGPRAAAVMPLGAEDPPEGATGRAPCAAVAADVVGGASAREKDVPDEAPSASAFAPPVDANHCTAPEVVEQASRSVHPKLSGPSCAYGASPGCKADEGAAYGMSKGKGMSKEGRDEDNGEEGEEEEAGCPLDKNNKETSPAGDESAPETAEASMSQGRAMHKATRTACFTRVDSQAQNLQSGPSAACGTAGSIGVPTSDPTANSHVAKAAPGEPKPSVGSIAKEPGVSQMAHEGTGVGECLARRRRVDQSKAHAVKPQPSEHRQKIKLNNFLKSKLDKLLLGQDAGDSEPVPAMPPQACMAASPDTTVGRADATDNAAGSSPLRLAAESPDKAQEESLTGRHWEVLRRMRVKRAERASVAAASAKATEEAALKVEWADITQERTKKQAVAKAGKAQRLAEEIEWLERQKVDKLERQQAKAAEAAKDTGGTASARARSEASVMTQDGEQMGMSKGDGVEQTGVQRWASKGVPVPSDELDVGLRTDCRRPAWTSSAHSPVVERQDLREHVQVDGCQWRAKGSVVGTRRRRSPFQCHSIDGRPSHGRMADSRPSPQHIGVAGSVKSDQERGRDLREGTPAERRSTRERIDAAHWSRERASAEVPREMVVGEKRPQERQKGSHALRKRSQLQGFCEKGSDAEQAWRKRSPRPEHRSRSCSDREEAARLRASGAHSERARAPSCEERPPRSMPLSVSDVEHDARHRQGQRPDSPEAAATFGPHMHDVMGTPVPHGSRTQGGGNDTNRGYARTHNGAHTLLTSSRGPAAEGQDQAAWEPPQPAPSCEAARSTAQITCLRQVLARYHRMQQDLMTRTAAMQSPQAPPEEHELAIMLLALLGAPSTPVDMHPCCVYACLRLAIVFATARL
jgi:hypothetical protein